MNTFPNPDPSLRLLDRFVGSWAMRGRLPGAEEDNVIGEATFAWLDGGFFLQQDVELDFAGMMQIRSRELIGHDPETGAFASHVYSNVSPVPLPYRWEVNGDVLRISVKHGPLDASFEGRFSADGNRFHGGWRPNPGADQNVNFPYDIGGERIR